MCGIVGVVGNRNATDILMQGLEKLEYRGYDSAGIYVINQPENGRLIKSVGRIADLRAKIGIDVAGSTGIGHTRWATDGGKCSSTCIGYRSSCLGSQWCH